MKIEVKEIEVTRGTGLSALCGETKRVADWDAAAAELEALSSGVERGRVDTVDFVVIFGDGFRYAGEFELRHPLDRAEAPNLAGHIVARSEEFLSDDPHWTKFRERYDASGERAAKIRQILDAYSFGDAPTATPSR